MRRVGRQHIPRESCQREACEALQGHAPAPHHGDSTTTGMVLALSHNGVEWMVMSRYGLSRSAGLQSQRPTATRAAAAAALGSGVPQQTNKRKIPSVMDTQTRFSRAYNGGEGPP